VKSKGTYKVKVTVGDATVEVEGAESGVVKIVDALADVLRGSRKSPSFSIPGPVVSPQSPPARSVPLDIRAFFEEKSPSTDVEAAAVAAYYYKYLAPEDERREAINPTILHDAFRLARRPLPKVARFTLQNARNAGYLDASGESGHFRLNAVGYNLVEHTLGGSKEVTKGKRKKKRKPRKQAS